MADKKKKKLTIAVTIFGILGASTLAYAFMRRPRHLFDGMVQVCEGSAPLIGIDQLCTELAMTRGNGSGKIFAPFDGQVESDINGVLTIIAKNTPDLFHFKMDRGAAKVPVGASFKSGDVIGQAERVKVSASRAEGSTRAPTSPSAWLIAHSLLPASQKSSLWCEDSHQVIVPMCEGVTFRPPTLPKWSLRTVRMTM